GRDHADGAVVPDGRIRGGAARCVGTTHRRVRPEPQSQRPRHGGPTDEPLVEHLRTSWRGDLLMRRRLALSLLFGCAVGCGGASADPGLTAYLRLSGAQYVPGELTPQRDATAPLV